MSFESQIEKASCANKFRKFGIRQNNQTNWIHITCWMSFISKWPLFLSKYFTKLPDPHEDSFKITQIIIYVCVCVCVILLNLEKKHNRIQISRWILDHHIDLFSFFSYYFDVFIQPILNFQSFFISNSQRISQT